MSRLDHIDPKLCRRWVAERCDVDVVARAYETAYRTVVARRPSDGAHRARPYPFEARRPRGLSSYDAPVGAPQPYRCSRT
jgi:hypothetical protein